MIPAPAIPALIPALIPEVTEASRQKQRRCGQRRISYKQAVDQFVGEWLEICGLSVVSAVSRKAIEGFLELFLDEAPQLA